MSRAKPRRHGNVLQNAGKRHDAAFSPLAKSPAANYRDVRQFIAFYSIFAPYVSHLVVIREQLRI
jgi:hypothetical protein